MKNEQKKIKLEIIQLIMNRVVLMLVVMMIMILIITCSFFEITFCPWAAEGAKVGRRTRNEIKSNKKKKRTNSEEDTHWNTYMTNDI